MSEDRLGDLADDRAVYIISVAAELAGVHPQTLRIYERKGLLRPARTKGNTRRYSERDIAQLRMIQRMTQDLGVNLAGVKMIVEMRLELERIRQETERLSAELDRARKRAWEEMERVHGRTRRAEIVPLSTARSVRLRLGRIPPADQRRASRLGPIPLGPVPDGRSTRQPGNE